MGAAVTSLAVHALMAAALTLLVITGAPHRSEHARALPVFSFAVSRSEPALCLEEPPDEQYFPYALDEDPPSIEPEHAEIKKSESPAPPAPPDEVQPVETKRSFIKRRTPPPPATDQRPRNTDAGTVKSPPAFISNPPPDYPEEARECGFEGLVLLDVLVSENGACIALEVKQSSGYETLDAAAAEAVRKWTFTPATENGRRVKGKLEIPIRFELTD